MIVEARGCSEEQVEPDGPAGDDECDDLDPEEDPVVLVECRQRADSVVMALALVVLILLEEGDVLTVLSEQFAPILHERSDGPATDALGLDIIQIELTRILRGKFITF